MRAIAQHHGRGGPFQIAFLCAVIPACGSTAIVAPSHPTQLAITALPDIPIEGVVSSGSVRVEIRDATGARVAGAQNIVTLSLGSNPAGGTLSGPTTASAVMGVATFSGLTLDKAGRYTLVATSAGLTPATSAELSVSVRYLAINANDQHTCGIAASGVAHCWGSNDAGQLGDGTQVDRILSAPVNAPTLRFSSVSLGLYSFTCGLTLTAEVYCWGSGELGQMGVPNVLFRLSPRLLSLPGSPAVITMDAGYIHGCALITGGSLYCWGGVQPLPALVPQPPGVTFVSVSAGVYGTCALDAAGGAWCWGSNQDGGVGDGTLTERTTPTRVLTPGGVTFVSLETGGPTACGLTGGGAIYCWGRNDRGQVGDGTNTQRLTPVLVQAPSGVTFSGLSVGADYACALAASGPAYCWGNNVAVTLGDGTSTNRSVPTIVHAPSGVTFLKISAGFSHTCAVTAIGSAYCWGQNGVGELGDGTTQLRNVPTRVVR
jgi:alpha-tubulin suppressor-like RCC1 family protein